MRAFGDLGPGGPNPGARGNPCRVELYDGEPAAEPAAGAMTLCRSWRNGDAQAELRCWSAGGTAVQLCGHGLLCTGVAWRLHGGALTALRMNGLRADFSRSEGIAWVGLPPLDTAPCAAPDWLSALFPSPPLRCAHAGGSDGYLVLEWPAGTDLRALPAPGPQLRAHTRRALIATSPARGQRGVDLQLRYFAPQYDSAEDSATGSAMRVLAGYWQARCGDALKAWQCSPDGGLLLSRMDAGRCWIGGRVQLEAST